ATMAKEGRGSFRRPVERMVRDRSPDAAKRNPGPGRGGDHSPDSIAFNPGYDLCSTLATSMAHTTVRSLTRSAISSHRISLTFYAR
ncbi:MAG: hypothetical protein L0Y56_19040, partial [Nitrospira sp.]|nr:hypothetical protein [Nitrospira sp.]